VVLMDEIEKAHPDVWNMLLQIMEEGRLTDNVGRMIDFKNTILILTTNIGSEQIAGRKSFGYDIGRAKNEEAGYTELKAKLQDEMSKAFRPEFLNRLDDVIVFRSLTNRDLKRIVDIELAKVRKRLTEKGLALDPTDAAKQYLINKGSSTEFGARPLRRAIEQNLEDPMAEDLLRDTFTGKDTIRIETWHKLTGTALISLRPAGIPDEEWSSFTGLQQMKFQGATFKPEHWLEDVKRAVTSAFLTRYSSELEAHVAVLEKLLPLLPKKGDEAKSLVQDDFLAEVSTVLPAAVLSRPMEKPTESKDKTEEVKEKPKTFKEELLERTVDMEKELRFLTSGEAPAAALVGAGHERRG
jgi:hypothetical protein